MRFKRSRPSSPPVYLPKWNEAVLREGFVPFSKTMLRCLNDLLSDTAEEGLLQLQVILAIADAKHAGPLVPLPSPTWPTTST